MISIADIRTVGSYMIIEAVADGVGRATMQFCAVVGVQPMQIFLLGSATFLWGLTSDGGSNTSSRCRYYSSSVGHMP